MLASDIQVPLPLVDRGTSAVAAARHIARDHLAALVVADASGTPIGVVSSADVLGLLVPSYVLQDMSLAGVLDEAGAEEMWSYADNRTIGELLDDDGVRVRELLTIDGDSTLIETAALMVDAHAQIAVVNGNRPSHVRDPARGDGCDPHVHRRARRAVLTIQIGLALAVFAGAYILIATEKVPRVTVALVGAALMVLIGATDDQSIFFSEDSGIDWNVIFLLLGMMIIVGILQQSGVFEYLAIWAAKRARGRPFLIMVMLVLITAVLSAFLDNVTTVLLVAPVTLLICDRLGTSPVPFLIAEVMASNIGGTSTLIGDPPNIIIASRGGLTFNDFIVNLAPIVAVLLAVFVGLCWLCSASSFHYDAARVAARSWPSTNAKRSATCRC